MAQREHAFSFEEYVEAADRSPVRVELWDGVVLDMSGGSPRHSAICNNVGAILRAQLRGKPCRAFDANLRVRSLTTNRTTYADVTVVCGPLELDPADRTRQTVLNPTVVIEVLSKTTQSDDCGPKLDCYKSIGSVRAVLLVAQHERRITLHARGADGAWVEEEHTAGSIDLSVISCLLPLDEVYGDLPED